jgi:hypothetical protein
MEDAFVGIDVAFAKTKRLPVVVSVWREDRLQPLPLRGKATISLPPRGQGNLKAVEPVEVEKFTEEAFQYLKQVEKDCRVRIKRIAIDAPSDPKTNGTNRRAAERALGERGISYIATPSEKEFTDIQDQARKHVTAGHPVSRIPHANQLWMLVGFSLFARLRQQRSWECLEVFPQATMAVLGANAVHKRSPEGRRVQFEAVARRTGWPPSATVSALRDAAFGSIHDCLDAYSASWVAALDEAYRMPLGRPPADVIWVPRIFP